MKKYISMVVIFLVFACVALADSQVNNGSKNSCSLSGCPNPPAGKCQCEMGNPSTNASIVCAPGSYLPGFGAGYVLKLNGTVVKTDGCWHSITEAAVSCATAAKQSVSCGVAIQDESSGQPATAQGNQKQIGSSGSAPTDDHGNPAAM
jgi:hypothetical protein